MEETSMSGWTSRACLATAFAVSGGFSLPAVAESDSCSTQLVFSPHPDGNSQFGSAVEISADWLVVGRPGPGGAPGRAYVYALVGNAWALSAVLEAQSDASQIDDFAGRLARDGDTIAICAPRRTVNGQSEQGAVFVFRESSTGWIQEAVITASDGAAGDRFGTDVAIVDNTLVIGAKGVDVQGHPDAGVVYLYDRTGAQWNEAGKFHAGEITSGGGFGSSVAMSGNTIAIGAPQLGGGDTKGAVHVMERTAGSWAQPVALSMTEVQPGSQAGNSIALDGDTIVVGAELADLVAQDGGLAYCFERIAGEWSMTATLFDATPHAGDWFGMSVAVLGDWILVGSWRDDSPSEADIGSAQLFIRGDAALPWSAGEVFQQNQSGSNYFGVSVSLGGGRLAAGSHHGGPVGDAGYAFTAQLAPVVEIQSQTETACLAEAIGFSATVGGIAQTVTWEISFDGGAWHGIANGSVATPCNGTIVPLAISASAAELGVYGCGGTLAVRAIAQSACGPASSDPVYVIVTGENCCLGDIDQSGSVDATDLSMLLGSWGQVSAGQVADLSGDAMVDAADLAALLGQWGPCG
jgi:hypothetical protein